MTDEAEKYRQALIEVAAILETMPSIDYDADPNDTSPEDMIGHVTGLAIQVINKALKSAKANDQ